MDKVRVLLVDDHTVVRRGLRKILESTPEIEVVGEVGDGAQALTAATSLHPDVVLMDISLPGLNGIEATRRITATTPGTQVLMLSMHADEQYVRQSIGAGAKGYLLKDADDQDLVSAVLAVRKGETYFSGTLARTVIGEGGRAPDVLSPREREVLALICSGRTNREVAEALGLSVNTIETHRKHIIDKLDLHSTAELVRYAIRHGMAS
ncbi:MAG: response regulator transcription factor [Deltaproteobacteria bacterium]|nr:response regulator transcription factor [Deltaproteobacteria bacterium]